MHLLKLGVTFIISFCLGFYYFYTPEQKLVTETLYPTLTSLNNTVTVTKPSKKKVIVKKPEHSQEQIKLAKAIDRIYKNVSYSEALNIVKITYIYARKHSIKPTLALGLIAAESGFNRRARSIHGAIGYTQVVPKWHQDKIKGRNLEDLHVNIQVGMNVLGDCFKKFKGNTNKALGCYNGATQQDKVNQYVNKVNHRKHEILQLASL